jgi:hypothetical protein
MLELVSIGNSPRQQDTAQNSRDFSRQPVSNRYTPTLNPTAHCWRPSGGIVRRQIRSGSNLRQQK